MGTNIPHACIPGLVWQKRARRFPQSELKVGELGFPIHFVCVSAALYHRGHAAAILSPSVNTVHSQANAPTVRARRTNTFDARASSRQTSILTCVLPTCRRHVRCTQVYSWSIKAHQALKSPRGCPHVLWKLRVIVWPGHSVFLSFSDSKFVRWFSLATAVGLLCDEYWTGCVDGRHIISSRTTSED